MNKKALKTCILLVLILISLLTLAACKTKQPNVEEPPESHFEVPIDTKDFELKVNGYTAKVEGDDLFVTVSNTRKISLTSVLNPSDYKIIKYYYDRECTHEITDISNIFTQEDALILYIKTISNDDNIKVYKLNINISLVDIPPEEALPYDNRLYSIKINNAYADVTDDVVYFTVPYDTQSITINNWAICSSATIEFYRDPEYKDKIENLNDLAIGGQNKDFFIVVSAENGEKKSYTLRISIFKSSLCELENITINNVGSYREGDYVAFDIPFTETISINSVEISKGAQINYYFDSNGNNEISDISNIQKSDLAKSGNSYFMYARIVSDNGYYSNHIRFKLNIAPCSDNQIVSVVVNGQKAEVQGNSVYIGIEKTTYLKFDDIQVSHYASYKFNNTNNYVYNVFNGSYWTKGSTFDGAITVTAEDGVARRYELHIDLIPSDCMIGNFAVNGIVLPTGKNINEITIPYAESLEIVPFANGYATLEYFWDKEYTMPIADHGNIQVNERINDIFIKVTKDNQRADYKLTVIVSQKPIIIAEQYKSIQLDKWQQFIDLHNYFTVNANDYPDYQIEYYLDGVNIPDHRIKVENIAQNHNVTIKVKGAEFGEVSAQIIMSISPYEILPLEVTVNPSVVYKKNQIALGVSDLFAIDSGDYVFGEQFKLQLTSIEGSIYEFSDYITRLALPAGNYAAAVIGLTEECASHDIGEINISEYVLIAPQIYPIKNKTEIRQNEAPLAVEKLFTIEFIDYPDCQIIYYLLEAGQRVRPITVLNDIGNYSVEAVVYYGINGVISAIADLSITENISSNTNAEIILDDNALVFTDGKYSAGYNYFNDRHSISVTTESAHASMFMTLNGTELDSAIFTLIEGLNRLTIEVTAEDESKRTYVVELTRNAKVAPNIIIQNEQREYQLSKGDTEIDLLQFFVIEYNDYNDVALVLSENGTSLTQKLAVKNEVSIHIITVEVIGEFGTIEKNFEIQILPYKEVTILLKPNCYEFYSDESSVSIETFYDKMEVYGYDYDTLDLIFLVDNRNILGVTQLSEGSHNISIAVLTENSVVAKKEFIVVVKARESGDVTISQNFASMVAEERNVTLSVSDMISMTCNGILEDDVIIECDFNGSHYSQGILTLGIGNNVIDFYVRNRNTNALISYAQFNFNIIYKQPLGELVDKVIINGISYDPDNSIVFETGDMSIMLEVSLKLVDGTIVNLDAENQVYGKNVLNYDGYEIVVYCLYRHNDYISECNYVGDEAEIVTTDGSLEIKVSDPSAFDLNAVRLTLNAAKTEGITYLLSWESASLFKVQYFYEGSPVSFRYGMVSDYNELKLFDAVQNVKAEGRYVICEWSSNFIYAVVSDIKSFIEYNIELGMHDGYSYSLTPIADVVSGENKTPLIITDEKGRTFAFEFVLYVHSTSVIDIVKYNGTALRNNGNGQYLIDMANLRNIDTSFVDWSYTSTISHLNVSKKETADKDNNVYKIKYIVNYERTQIETFEVVISNSDANVGVIIEDTPVEANKNVFNIDYTYNEDDMWGNSNLNIYFHVARLALIEGLDAYKLNDSAFVLQIDTATIPENFTVRKDFTIKAVNGFYKNYVLNISLRRTPMNVLFTINGAGQVLEFSQSKISHFMETLEFDSVRDTVSLDIVSSNYTLADGAMTQTLPIVYDAQREEYYISLQVYNANNELTFEFDIQVNFVREGRFIGAQLTVDNQVVYFYDDESFLVNENGNLVLKASTKLSLPIGTASINGILSGRYADTFNLRSVTLLVDNDRILVYNGETPILLVEIVWTEAV